MPEIQSQTENPSVLAKRHTTVSLSFLKFTGLQLMVAQQFSRNLWRVLEGYLLDALPDAQSTAEVT